MNIYTLYLPLTYNDGTPIERATFEQIRNELTAMFGALTATSSAAPLEGVWVYEGVSYQDKIIKIEVITEGNVRTEQFFSSYRETLKERLQQLDILITVQEIRTLR
jgi:hypothetical protein